MRLHLYILKLLFLIRLGFQTHRKYVSIQIVRADVLSFIHLMYCWGFISSYFFCTKTNCFMLELAYTRQQPVLSNIRFFLYHGSLPYIPFKLLLTLYLREDTIFYVLYTSRGILLDKEAISYGVGGFLLFSFC